MDTFASRIFELIQKSRKASRLYATMGKHSGKAGLSQELTEVQADQWRKVNVELVSRLAESFDRGESAAGIDSVIQALAFFEREAHRDETELTKLTRELIEAANHSDFVRSTILSKELVGLKAKVQAAQAAAHEIELVLKRSRIDYRQAIARDRGPYGETLVTQEGEQSSRLEPPGGAQIIPLRKLIG